MLIEEWEETILAQYANSTNLLALLRVMNRSIDPRDDVDEFYRTIMDLDTCNEWGLYIWSVILAAPRAVALVDESVDFFGFRGSDFTPFFDAPFFNGRWGYGYSELVGEDLRRLLWFKAAVNIINTNVPDIEDAIQTFLDGRPEGEPRVSVVVHEPSKMIVEAAIFDGELTRVERAILAEYGGMVTSSGVAFRITEGHTEPPDPPVPESLPERLWSSWKRSYFNNGRIQRPNDDYDTVSEGVAYGMMWAVWFDDPDTFDAVYAWTEDNLSRYSYAGDHLLSWKWGRLGGGDTWGIQDRMPAADADLDYTLALIMAGKKWPDRTPPVGLLGYTAKAVEVARSIMQLLVLDTPNGEKYLVPWVYNDDEKTPPVLTNPSYFSPGHFRAIYDLTGLPTWQKLYEDSYAQIERILTPGEGEGNVITVPDWLSMNADGTFVEDPSRGYTSAWEAFRYWWRVRLDLDAFDSERARSFITDRLAPFVRKNLDAMGGELFAAEVGKYGDPLVTWGNSGMDAVHWWALRNLGVDDEATAKLKEVAMSRLMYDGNVYAYFQDRGDYYTNSWAWYAALDDDAPNIHADILRTGPPPSEWPKAYHTVDGDTLESVAEMFYGNGG